MQCNDVCIVVNEGVKYFYSFSSITESYRLITGAAAK